MAWNFKGHLMKNEQDYFTPDQLEQIYKACSNERDLLFIKLGVASGRRISEILGMYDKLTHTWRGGLKPSDIDFFANRVNWCILKKKDLNYKTWKPLCPKMLNQLRDYIQASDIKYNDRIFKFTRRWGDKIIKKACEKVGIKTMSGNKKPHYHALRHTWTYLQRMMGTDILFIYKNLEHSDIRLTLEYNRIMPRELEPIMAKMENFV